MFADRYDYADLDGFGLLQKQLGDSSRSHEYYSGWVQRYGTDFKKENTKIVEWDVRIHKALKEVFTSAAFYLESKVAREHGLWASYYFLSYYALLHGLWASVVLIPGLSPEILARPGHDKIMSWFASNFTRTRHPIISPTIEKAFNALRFAREYHSYAAPMNDVLSEDPAVQNSLSTLDELLAACMQLANLHSFLAEKGARHASDTIDKKEEIETLKELFYRFNARPDAEGKEILDPSDRFALQEKIRFGCEVHAFCILIDHFIDEFRHYQLGRPRPEHGVSSFDAAKFVYDAMCRVS